MATTVALRLGRFFARISPAERGKDPVFGKDGWFPVHFDRTEPGSDETFEIEPVDGKLKIRHPGSNTLLNADATEFGGNICAQFHGKPDGEGAMGSYESWNGWTLGNDGINVVMIEYDRDGAKYTSACLTVVEL